MFLLLSPLASWYFAKGRRYDRWVSRVMTPTSYQDPHIVTLQRVRAWLGALLLALVLASAFNHTQPGAVAEVAANGVDAASSIDVGDIFAGLLLAPFMKALIALPCFLVAVVALTASHSRGSRASVVARGLKPVAFALGLQLVQVLPYVGLGVMFVAFGGNETTNGVSTPRPLSGGEVAAAFGLAIALLLLTPVLAWGALRGMLLGLRYTFRGSDAHPLLPAIVGIAVALVSAGRELWQLPSRTGVQAELSLLALGGAAVVAALGLYELSRLKAAGVTWP